MNTDLMKAILSMDAYNRGYDAGIRFGANPENSEDSPGTQIGNAIIYDSKGDTAARNIGFYALAYAYNGETVISYRGTDDVDGVPNPLTDLDVYHGWSLGLGNADSQQGQMAIRFYQDVAGAGNWRTANISLTGHSLGGGLAGLVAGLYQQDAQTFDSMDYNPGLLAYDRATSDPGLATYDPDIKNLVYGTSTPWSQNTSGISATHIEGEALGFVRLSASTPLDLGDDVSGLGPVDKHSMATLVIRMFADETEIVAQGDGWRNAAKYFWPVLYDGEFAKSIGMDSAAVQGKMQTDAAGGETEKYADILRTIIAYSAIAEGKCVFGDTGIRALYNDANDLGVVLAAPGASTQLAAHAEDISKVFVQFAGQLALAKIEQSGHMSDGLANADAGVVNLLLSDGMLAVDLSDTRWSLISAGVTPQSSLVKAIYDSSGMESALRAATKALWNDDTVNAIDRVLFSLSDAGGSYTIPEKSVPTDGGTLFLAGNGSNTITGSSGNDMIFGSDAGDDIINGGAGDDILHGWGDNQILPPPGGGSDVLHGGDGDDILMGWSDGVSDSFYGDEGFDTASYAGLSGSIDVSPLLEDPDGADWVVYEGGTSREVSRLWGIEKIAGTTSSDSFTASSHDVTFSGGKGNDTYIFDLEYASGLVIIEEPDLQGVDTIQFKGVSESSFYFSSASATINGMDYTDFVILDAYGESEKLRVRISDSEIASGGGVESVQFGSDSGILVDDLVTWGQQSSQPLAIQALQEEIYGYTGDTGGTGAGGGIVPDVASDGSFDSVHVSPLVSGSWFPYGYAEQVLHPFIITGYSITPHSSGGGSTGSITMESYMQKIIFHRGITADDVRFSASSGSLGNAGLTVTIDPLNFSVTIPDFEAGRFIEGLGVYGQALHQQLQEANSATLTGLGNGNYRSDYDTDYDVNPNTGLISVTYFLEQIVFANGSTIDMTAPLLLQGTEGGESITGFDTRSDILDGRGGDDYLYGYGGNDTLTGGAGNDSLYGGAGDDTYLFGAGDDQEYVYEDLDGGTDTILTTFASTGVRSWFDAYGYFCLASAADPSDVLKINNYTLSSTGSDVGQRVERIAFSDGVV